MRAVGTPSNFTLPLLNFAKHRKFHVIQCMCTHLYAYLGPFLPESKVPSSNRQENVSEEWRPFQTPDCTTVNTEGRLRRGGYSRYECVCVCVCVCVYVWGACKMTQIGLMMSLLSRCSWFYVNYMYIKDHSAIAMGTQSHIHQLWYLQRVYTYVPIIFPLSESFVGTQSAYTISPSYRNYLMC